jgi:hypothetical protein
MGVIMNRKLLGALLGVFSICGVLSCSDKMPTEPGLSADDASADANRVIASASVTLDRTSIDVGQTTRAHAVLLDGRNRPVYRTVAWSSANPRVASVSTSGVVTALAAGSTSIIGAVGRRTASATLTVTRVSGTGASSVASVKVTLASPSIAGGQTTQASATVYDSSNNVLADRTVTWSSSNPGVATVSSTGAVTAVAAGTSQIVGTSEGKSGSAPVTVTSAQPPPPPPSSDGSAEPVGMTVVSDRGFNAFNEPGWNDEFSSPDGGGMSIISDATAPKSPNNVLRATYPTRFTSAGTGPGGSDFGLRTRPRTLYVSFWGRVSDNWYGHDSGVNKQFYAYANGSPVMYFSAGCQYNGPITPYIALQSTASYGDADLMPNLVPGARITRGKWYHIEVVLVGNTAGTRDGSVDWWLDGVHIGSYSVQWLSGAATWNLFHYTTIWGGVGGPRVPATQYMDWDHVYLSGKS